MAKDAASAAAKWSRNIGSAGQSMKDGAQAVTQSPAQKAAQSVDLMLQNFTQAIQSGRYAAAAQKSSLSDWQQAYVNKGIPRATAAAAGAQSKVQTVLSKLIPQAQQIAASLPPRGNLQQNLQRAAAQATAMAALKGTFK